MDSGPAAPEEPQPSGSGDPAPPAEHQAAPPAPSQRQHQPQPPPSSSSPQQLSRYESQKRRDWNTFLQYLKSHKPPLTLERCSGAHVIEFLKYLDQFGKTKVHNHGCNYFGHPNQPAPCACPLKQAWGSLDALIGRLRAAYEENGGKPESNPFAAKAVRIYLREVRESQAKARGIPYEKSKKRKRAAAAASASVTAAAASAEGSSSAAAAATEAEAAGGGSRSTAASGGGNGDQGKGSGTPPTVGHPTPTPPPPPPLPPTTASSS